MESKQKQVFDILNTTPKNKLENLFSRVNNSSEFLDELSKVVLNSRELVRSVEKTNKNENLIKNLHVFSINPPLFLNLILTHINTSIGTQKEILTTKPDLSFHMVYSYNTNPKILDFIARDIKRHLDEISRNPITSISTLKYIYRVYANQDPTVIKALCGNENTPPEVLASIYEKFDDPYLHQDIAANSSTPVSTLKMIYNNLDNYGSRSDFIRSRLLSNSATPLEIIKESLKDLKPGDINNLLRNKDLPEEMVFYLLTSLEGSELNSKLSLVLDHPNISPRILEKISNITNEGSILRRVAYHSLTSLKVLFKLANHEDRDVRISVARNANVTEEILLKLSDDTDKYVLESVAENESTPCYILEKILEDNPSTPLNILRAIGNNPNLTEDFKIKVLPIIKQRRIQTLKNFKGLPRIDWENYSYTSSKINTDLEILKRLKGYLKGKQ